MGIRGSKMIKLSLHKPAKIPHKKEMYKSVLFLESLYFNTNNIDINTNNKPGDSPDWSRIKISPNSWPVRNVIEQIKEIVFEKFNFLAMR
jgi:hypothetical protein